MKRKMSLTQHAAGGECAKGHSFYYKIDPNVKSAIFTIDKGLCVRFSMKSDGWHVSWVRDMQNTWKKDKYFGNLQYGKTRPICVG